MQFIRVLILTQMAGERKGATELTDDSFEFMAAYTKNPNIQQLRDNVLSLKESLVGQVWFCLVYVNKAAKREGSFHKSHEREGWSKL